MPGTGVVTASRLNVRSEPSVSGLRLGQLPRGTRLRILQRHGAWLQIKSGESEGFVHGDFIRVLDEQPAAGFLWERVDLQGVPLEPPESSRIRMGPGLSPRQRIVAKAWNSQGGLLDALSGAIGTPVEPAVAILSAESGGAAFGADGRLVIRFENHIFWSQYGRRNSDVFARHFRYDAEERWRGHEFRDSAAGRWRPVHTSQAQEWNVFDFAHGLHEAAALRSTSMGAPQIMGFHHARLGYDSVQEMFERFCSGPRFQALALFDFIKGAGETSPLLEALRAGNFADFAALYNGPGRAAEYAAVLETYCETFRSLRPV